MSYLDVLLRKVLQVAGVSLTERRYWNFVSGATLVDNPTTRATDIIIATPTGTGFCSVTAGVLDVASIKCNLASTTYVTGTLGVANGGTGITSLGSGVATMLGTCSSANIAAACTDETGSGPLVFANAPTINYPVIGGQVRGNESTAIAVMAIDWSLGEVFTKTLAAGANTFTFANTGSGKVIVVRVTGAASTLTWPTVKWAGGVAPTQTASGIDVYTFVDDGTSIYGSVVQAMA